MLCEAGKPFIGFPVLLSNSHKKREQTLPLDCWRCSGLQGTEHLIAYILDSAYTFDPVISGYIVA